MASPKAALLLLAAALLVSCCYASRSAAVLVTGGEMEEKAVIQSDQAPCVVMPECTQDKCDNYCVEHGLGEEKSFCSLKSKCCCPIRSNDPPAATKIPASSTSAKQV